jgi:hypothetical protein
MCRYCSREAGVACSICDRGVCDAHRVNLGPIRHTPAGVEYWLREARVA